jgi:hypothetical protein
VYDMSIRFFPCMVLTNSNRHGTLGYERPLARCCHLVVCLVVSMDGLEDGYDYRDDYCITLIILSTTLLMYCFTCML